jgi:hypothetical protein
MSGLKKIFSKLAAFLSEKRVRREKVIAQGRMMSACIRRIK